VSRADAECPLCGEELLWAAAPDDRPTVRLPAAGSPEPGDPSSQPTAQYPAQPYPAAPATQYPADQYPATQYPAAPATQYPATQYPATQYPADQYPATQYPADPATQYPPPPPDRNPAMIPIVIIIAVLVVALITAGFFLTRNQGSNTAATSGPAPATSAPASTSTGVAVIPTTPATTPSATSADSGNLGQEAQVGADTTAPDGKDSDGNAVSYAAQNVVDGDPSTAWRTKGEAGGQSLTLSFPGPVTISEVGLINGYAKIDPKTGDNRYQQERRITSVQWEFDDGTDVDQTLQDGDQNTQLMTVGPVTTNTVKVTIETTTSPGDNTYDYTAISEIRLEGTGTGTSQ
jgi:hypothetical protein